MAEMGANYRFDLYQQCECPTGQRKAANVCCKFLVEKSYSDIDTVSHITLTWDRGSLIIEHQIVATVPESWCNIFGMSWCSGFLRQSSNFQASTSASAWCAAAAAGGG